MRKAVIISGPTASGKTNLSYLVAQNTPVALLNADSRHIYTDLSIVAGKDLPAEAEYNSKGYYTFLNTNFYLLDLVDATHEFNVSEYITAARSVISTLPQEITPVFVGGSNFYISALIEPMDAVHIPANAELRKELVGLSVLELQKRLQKDDSKKYSSMNDSDRKNPRRLIRAVEVALWRKTDNTQIYQPPVLNDFNIFHIGLTAPIEYIRQKVNARVDARLAQGGEEEVENLYKKFSSLSSGVKSANGYKQLFEYLQGNITREEAIQRWKFAEYHNAKKQLTWIHGDSTIKKYPISDPHFPDTVLHDILDFVHS